MRPGGHFYWQGLAFKVWDGITYPSLDFNGPLMGLMSNHVSKRGPWTLFAIVQITAWSALKIKMLEFRSKFISHFDITTTSPRGQYVDVENFAQCLRFFVIWFTWWRHQMEIFSALLAICAGNSPVTGEFPTKRPVTRSFDVFFDLHPNERLSKQSWGWWLEMLSSSLWRHRNVRPSFPLFSGLPHNTKNCQMGSVLSHWFIMTLTTWKLIPHNWPF